MVNILRFKESFQMSQTLNSVAIVGGGIAGLCLAASLKNDYKIELFEKNEYKSFIAGEHIPNAALNYFEKLNIPHTILIENSIKCYEINGFWAGKKIENEGIFRIGYDRIIDRPNFDKALYNWLQDEGVKVSLNSPIKSIEPNSITLSDNNKILFDFIVDCSGRTSNKFDNIRLVFDKLIGVSFYTKLKRKNNSSIVTIESSEEGWWYFTTNKKYHISTYFTDSDMFNKSKIIDIYRSTNKYAINKNDLVGKPIIKLCHTSILEKKPKDIYQIGDSFMSYDPLSSKGIYKAMKDAFEFSNSMRNNLFEDYYQIKRNEFLKYLETKKSFYKQGFTFYQTEFYNRRI